MMLRIIEIRVEITIAISECERAPTGLTAEEYKVLEEVTKLLEPFELATQKISGEEYITISLILQLIRGIAISLASIESSLNTPIAQNILDGFKQSRAKRLKPYEMRTPIILSTILDPRLKKRGLKPNKVRNMQWKTYKGSTLCI